MRLPKFTKRYKELCLFMVCFGLNQAVFQFLFKGNVSPFITPYKGFNKYRRFYLHLQVWSKKKLHDCSYLYYERATAE